MFVSGTLYLCSGPEDYKRCTDKDGIVVEDEKCSESSNSGGSHRWYYGGSGYRSGERVSGGSNLPAKGVAYHSVTRGGFGGSGGSHAIGS